MFKRRAFIFIAVAVFGVFFSASVYAQALFTEPPDEAISYRHVRDTHPNVWAANIRPLWVDSQNREYNVDNGYLYCAPIEDGHSNRTVITQLSPPQSLGHPRSTLVGPMTNRDDVYVMYIGGDGAFEIRKFNCNPGGPISSGSVISQGQSPLFVRSTVISNRMNPNMRTNSQGDLCIWTDDQLICGNIFASNALDTWEVHLTAAELEIALDEPSIHAPLRGWIGRPHWNAHPPSWYISGAGWAPDGTMLAFITRSHTAREFPGNAGSARRGFTHIFVIEISPDGEIKKRLGPYLSGWSATTESGPYATPLVGSQFIHYHPELDAFLMPAEAIDYGEEDYEINNPRMVEFLGHYTGVGLNIFPIGLNETGYISLTKHAIQAFRCGGNSGAECTRQEDWRPGTNFISGANGAFYHILRNQFDSVSMHEVILGDLDHHNVDDDGLTGAEERALGTSTWHKDSDMGGSHDDIELLLGTDPTDGADDRARVKHDPLNWLYMESPLLEFALTERIEDPIENEWAINISGRGPLCFGGSCYAPGGEVVAQYGNEATGRPGITTDGQTIVFPVDSQLHFHHLASGDINIVELGPELSEFGDFGEITRIYPLDTRRVWLVNDNKLGFWTPSTGVNIVYDQNQARCDSGLGDCRPDQLTAADLHDVATWFDPLGYHFGLQRFLIHVRGRWEFYIVGVHAEEPPMVLDTNRSLFGFGPPYTDYPQGYERRPILPPISFMIPSYKGHYLTYYGIFGPGYEKEMMGLSANDNVFEHAHSVWGGRIIAPSTGTATFVELVPYQVGIEPGDSLMLRAYSSETPHHGGAALDVTTGTSQYGLQLYRIGPRGGMIPLWTVPKKGYGKPGGMDVSADGNMCAVFPDEGLFVEWTAGPNSNNMPLFEHFRGEFAMPVDCLYGPDGEVYILGKSPVRVERWDRTSMETEDITDELELPQHGEPISLLMNPDGEIEVLMEGEITAKAYMPDGRAVTLRSEGVWASLWVDDEQLTFQPLFNPSITGAHQNHDLTHGVIVPRPDNRIFLVPWGMNRLADVISPGRLLVVDLATGQQLLAAHQSPPSGNAGPQPAAAAVPGGIGLDPWTLDENLLPTLDDSDNPDNPDNPNEDENNDTPDDEPKSDPIPAPDAPYPEDGSPRFDDDDPSCSLTSPHHTTPPYSPAILLVALLAFRPIRRPIIILAGTALFLLAGCGSDDSNYQGDCPQGAIAMERIHSDDTFEEWCETDGIITGPYAHWNPDRTWLITLGQFEQDLPTGYWTFNFPDTGQTKLAGNYHDGQAHGEWREHNATGQQVSIRHYYLGTPCGSWQFYEDGSATHQEDFGPCG